MSYPKELYWLLPNETPTNGTTVIVESLNGTMYVDFIGPVFDSWGDDIARWAYFPDKIYEKIKHVPDDYYSLKMKYRYYKEENEELKKLVEDWHNKYLNLLGKQHNEHQREAFVGTKIKREFLDDNCGSVNSDGDECPATDDLCEVCESDDARPVGEVSIDELRDIFLKVLREARERERAEEDDGK